MEKLKEAWRSASGTIYLAYESAARDEQRHLACDFIRTLMGMSTLSDGDIAGHHELSVMMNTLINDRETVALKCLEYMERVNALESISG